MTERLRNELAGLIDTLDRSRGASLRSVSEGGLRFDVDFDVVSLYREGHAAVEERGGVVTVSYQLHPQHPQVTPVAVALTPRLFNVHINDPENCAPQLPPIPLICLGPFLPHMRVSDQVVVTYDLLRWARISTERPMNEAAAQFARRESAKPGRFPVDLRHFWRAEAEQGAAARPELPGSRGAQPRGPEPAGTASVGLRLGSEWRTT
jgi:hypothetical protein